MVGSVSDTPIIAVVDDDEMVTEATGALIETFGLAARTFASAEAFLNSDCVSQTSCLVCDIQMPGMGGLQLQFELSRSGHKIPFILITAFPDDATRKQALKAGATCYLIKPFSPFQLFDCIRSAIGHWDG